jgi:hypothetical protein
LLVEEDAASVVDVVSSDDDCIDVDFEAMKEYEYAESCAFSGS